MQNEKSKFKIVLVLLILVLAIAGGVWFLTRPPATDYNLASFAACLKSKGATMYGAAWCPHCENEKRAFGDYFREISYVECPQNVQLCAQLGIQEYPTWTMGDGRRFEGEQGLAKLSEESGCPLIKK